jgi:hypothetical protein
MRKYHVRFGGGPRETYSPNGEQRASGLPNHLTGKHETYGELRAEHETIAEASAYVVLAHFGLDSGERSFPYVAVWAHDRTVLRGVLGTIQGVATTLISRVEAQNGGAMPQKPDYLR